MFSKASVDRLQHITGMRSRSRNLTRDVTILVAPLWTQFPLGGDINPSEQSFINNWTLGFESELRRVRIRAVVWTSCRTLTNSTPLRRSTTTMLISAGFTSVKHQLERSGCFLGHPLLETLSACTRGMIHGTQMCGSSAAVKSADCVRFVCL